MSEVVNVLVAFAVIIFLFRWMTSASDSGTDEQRRAANMLGFRPKNVTPEMINSVSAMFPDIPMQVFEHPKLSGPNVHYDLLRTGNVELTTNKILERGFLESPPPAFHTLYPTTSPNGQLHPHRTASNSASLNQQKAPVPKGPSLIERYKLQERVQTGEVIAEEDVGGKAKWEDNPEKREASLKERKTLMILAARQRFLASQQASSS